MIKRRQSNHHFTQHLSLFKRRMIAIAIAVGLLVLTLVGRLIDLQWVNHKVYSTLSQQNLMNIIPLVPDRGLIYDRNGVLIAKNEPVYSLDVVPGRIKNLTATLNAINKIIPLTDNDRKNFKRALNQHHRYDEVPLKINLTESEVANFYVNQYRFPGVSIQPHMMRVYPLGKTTGEVLGYVGRINAQELAHIDAVNYSGSDYIGKVGIEKYFESALHGKVGAEEAEINARGQIVRVLKRIAPVPGKNLYLTIDSKLQAYAEKVLGHNSGALVAIQPATGQVLAMVTKPTYDPNIFVNGISQKEYKKLINAPQHPLYNRAIRGLYAPASTSKPYWALAGLNNHSINTHFRFFDTGRYQVPHTKHIFHDDILTGHGWVNLRRAITVSCDVYFYRLANKLGIRYMDQFLHQFGFGQLTGIEMPEELAGILPTPEWKLATQGEPWYTGDTIETGIGQGILSATPIEIAKAVSILAERGQGFKPHLLLSTEDNHNHLTVTSSQPLTPIILSNQNDWNIVIHDMEYVIDSPEGTAIRFGPHPGYKVAGKTGTAQVFGHHRDEERVQWNLPKRLRNHHLFIDFAPVNNPQIAVAVVIEHNTFADEIAGKVTRFYMNELKNQTRESHE